MYFKIAITSNGQINWKLFCKRHFFAGICHVGLIFHLEWSWTLRRVTAGPCLLDKTLIPETEKEKGEKARGGEKKTEGETRVPNHDCWGPAVYTISDRKGNVGGREGEHERLEKGVQWGKERNSFWGDMWLWLRGAVWTSQPLPLVLTGPFGGSWCCLFLNSKWLVNWWTRAMDTMTEQRLGILVAAVFTYLCIYVQFVRVHVQVHWVSVGMGDDCGGGWNIYKA